MTENAVDLAYTRLNGEEGRERFAYNDATGKRVTCQPGGNLSIAVGVNLEIGLDDEEIDWLSKYRLSKAEQKLTQLAWYAALDPVRQSVCLDIDFNANLLHFPHMIAALAKGDWATAAAECKVTNPELAGRYAALAQLLLTG